MKHSNTVFLFRFILLVLGFSFGVNANVALPVDLPTIFAPNSRKIFANYFSPFPLSIDNKAALSDYYTLQWLIPDGEGGIHKAYGGYLRDRPIPVAPHLNQSDFRLLNLEKEVEQAISAGIEGFVVDVLVPFNNSDFVAPVPSLLMRAAYNVNPLFKIIIQPDMATLFDLNEKEMATEIHFLATFPSAYKLEDGRVVVCPFLAEAQSAEWWKRVMDLMETDYSTPIAFFPLFLDFTNYTLYSNISYGMSNWGARDPLSNPTTNNANFSPLDVIQKVHNLGKLWMQPVTFEDVRPKHQIYEESQNTENLMNTWNITVDGGADWAHLVTWNDYSEATQFNPSVRHGWALLDISSYWIAKMKTGKEPVIVRDAFYLTHRTQFVNATTIFNATKPMLLRPFTSPPRDTIQVLSFLTAPGIIQIRAGSKSMECNVEAGVSTCIIPLAYGNVSATLYRDGIQIASLSSPFQIVENPFNQNLEYVVSSRRDSYGNPIGDSTTQTASSGSISTAIAPSASSSATIAFSTASILFLLAILR